MKSSPLRTSDVSNFAPLICFAAMVVISRRPEGCGGGSPREPSGHLADEVASCQRHALILCGHPGDAEHAKSFTETVRNSATDHQVRRDSLKASTSSSVRRNRKSAWCDRAGDTRSRCRAVAEVRRPSPQKTGCGRLPGHGHHAGRQAWWNLPGPDFVAVEFGKIFAEVNCREQVFVMTSSLSGYFVVPLAKRNRVVIAATEADAETNETTFPAVFAKVLAAGLDPAEHDVDKDGKLTLFDLYVVVAKEIAQNYASAEQLSTEHAQLDDDGDGIGHELQNAYLPEEQGGTPPGKKANKRPHRDGVRAAQLPLWTGK